MGIWAGVEPLVGKLTSGKKTEKRLVKLVYWNWRFMYFHVYLIYRFTRTFTDHSSVITRCWVFELQNGQSSLKSLQTLAAQSFAPASFLSTHSNRSVLIRMLRFSLLWNSIITLGPNNDNPNCMLQVGSVFGFIISIENVIWWSKGGRCSRPCVFRYCTI